MRNVADEQAQAQLNLNRGLNADLTDMHVNETGAIGVGGTPGDLIRSGREAQAAEAETDDQFDERVSSSPSIDDGGFDRSRRYLENDAKLMCLCLWNHRGYRL